MVGLVIVSHSRPLAQALVNLVKQVASSDAPIALAAGVGDDRQTFGTDAVEIMEAIESVFSPDGVLVLMDLGSAVLSAQMALELLAPDISEKVQICSAPLVEGAVAAGVQISLGSSLEMVAAEAQQALAPKQEHLGQTSEAETAPAVETTAPPAEAQAEVTLINLHGLHARPAARFVQKATSFDANVQVTNLTTGKGPVSARSLNAIATLGAVEHHRIRISASGPQAEVAVNALKAMVEAAFGESPVSAESTPAEPPAAQPAAVSLPAAGDGELRAVPISEGIALGPLYRYEPAQPTISTEPARDVQSEWLALQAAIQTTRQEISRRQRQVKNTLSADEAAIFEAHQMILQDPEMVEAARKAIFDDKKNAGAAWNAAVQTAAESYRSLSDDYLRQRAVDVEDVGRQVLLALMGSGAPQPVHFDHPVILYAEELTPTETAQLDLQQVMAIITAGGGPTSHSSILARGLGIPAIAGAGAWMQQTPAGTLVGLNGASGEIWIAPDSAVQTELSQQRQQWLDARAALLQKSQAHALTQDGTRVEVFANVGSPQDCGPAIQNGAEGVGLLRTEFLFLTRETAPSEDEQYQMLREIITAMGPDRPVTVRTMDVGGDKELAYIDLPEEANPFLGMRALRLSLDKPELFLPQLRAILRAAAGYPCRIMFPMVAELAEIEAARTWLEKAHQQLSSENIAHAWPAEVGIMVEIPSAALLSETLVKAVDFFSIGTNDLTQYTLAAERGNPALAYLADGLNPAVLKLIGQVCGNAHQVGKWVGICGELGGDPIAIPVLVGLGVDELSMSAPAIPRAKDIIRALKLSDAQVLAQKALQAASSKAVRALVKNAQA